MDCVIPTVDLKLAFSYKLYCPFR